MQNKTTKLGFTVKEIVSAVVCILFSGIIEMVFSYIWYTTTSNGDLYSLLTLINLLLVWILILYIRLQKENSTQLKKEIMIGVICSIFISVVATVFACTWHARTSHGHIFSLVTTIIIISIWVLFLYSRLEKENSTQDKQD